MSRPARPSVRGALAPVFARRGDAEFVEQLGRVQLDPPPTPVPVSVEDAIAVYRAAHPAATREQVYREAVRGRGLPGGRKREALSVIDAALEAPEQRRRVQAPGNAPGTRQRGAV